MEFNIIGRFNYHGTQFAMTNYDEKYLEYTGFVITDKGEIKTLKFDVTQITEIKFIKGERK